MGVGSIHLVLHLQLRILLGSRVLGRDLGAHANVRKSCWYGVRSVHQLGASKFSEATFADVTDDQLLCFSYGPSHAREHHVRDL